MLTWNERSKKRERIGRMVTFHEAIMRSLERGIALPQTYRMAIGIIAQSDNLETQASAVEEYLERERTTYRNQLRDEAQRSLSCFAEFINPEEPPAPHHEFMIEKLEKVENKSLMRLMISMPPGHAKSTYASHLFPAWWLGKNPDRRFIQAGHTQDFVDEELGKKVRGIIDSEPYREVFNGIKLDPSSKAASRFALAGHKGKYLGRGIGQGIAGFRSHCAAVDDPFATAKDAESQTIRDDAWRWFTSDFLTRLMPHCPAYMVATRWHTDDMCGRAEKMNKDPGIIPFEIINLPAICDIPNDPLGRQEGEALWPDLFSVEVLNAMKATMLAKSWNALYQGKPTDAAGNTFQTAWLKRYQQFPTNETDQHGNVVKLNIRRVVVSVDTANKTGQRNDFTAITVWIEGLDGHHYLVDVVRKRVEFNDLVTLVDRTVAKWNAKLKGSKVMAILMEDKGSGTQYIQTQRGRALAPVIPIEVGQNTKEFRFDGIMPMWEAGEALLPETASWLPDYRVRVGSLP